MFIFVVFTDMPRYQVKDAQESSSVKSASTGSKSSTEISTTQEGSDSTSGSSNSVSGFRPLYLPNSTQACHCSACVGAVAANVHPVRLRVCVCVCVCVIYLEEGERTRVYPC